MRGILIRLLTKEGRVAFSFVAVGVLLYLSTLTTPFRWDDMYQIVRTPLMHSLTNIPLLLLVSIRQAGSTGLLVDYFYRPIPFMLYCLLFVLGHGQPFIFHLFQLTVHIATSYVLWKLFQRFFSWHLAFFLALLFLIHPVNQEAVVYIANLPDLLFVFFGSWGLLLATSGTGEHQRRLLLCSGGLFLLSLLSKETGILFLVLLLIQGRWLSQHRVKNYLRLVIVVLGVYSLLRVAGSLHFYLTMQPLKLTLLQKLEAAPILFLSYLKEMVLPGQTITAYSRTVPVFSLSQVMAAYGVSLCLVIGSCIWMRYRLAKARQRVGVFFSAWSCMGLLFYLQLFTLDQFSAKRWLYFPLVGVLGVIGVVIDHYYQRRVARWIIVCLSIGVIGFFLYQTLTLNAYWDNDVLLLRHSR